MLPQATARDADSAIRQTDTDAALARLSAVQKHYLQDPFVKALVPRAHLQQARPPLINVGTYVRSEGIDELVDRWLDLAEQEGVKVQVVSLGAGSDTRFWRIETGSRKGRLSAYLEVDFAEITTKKAMAIKKSKELSKVLGQPEDIKLGSGGMALHSPIYHLIPADLRLPPSETLSSALATPGSPLLSPSLPTLLLFECVLVYMSPEASCSLIQWFTDYFSQGSGPLGGIVYEMFGLSDSFGRVMHENLKARGVSLPGVVPYPDVASLPQRFLQHSFSTAHALTLRDIRRTYISLEEAGRISKLEMLDEIEELELVLGHYAITWGVKLPDDGSSLKAHWSEWGLQPKSTGSNLASAEDD
ncbi:leucine carboxyl methyltransferase [Neolentinus lepideus HHB14362 ss-1]|uniref:Leucine carboxyl methyltransferase 1 n=1 Tax=Neolentinus lepideus HHB14362 ss-1 TaxID=1314782 RepID=A0A165PHP8_9AGAM|nr:leucine carboxyl methyltransferase [Neolentinus lepideus HHB14362 ss-1]